MAHCVENMFSVKQTPWHGLGTVIQDAPTIQEGIKLAGLDWKVLTQPLYLADGREAPAQVTVRETDQSILGVVGPKWQPLQNTQAFSFFDPFLETGAAKLTTAGSLDEGRRVWVLAELNRDPVEILPGDAVRKFLLLSNSHDGTLAVRVSFTPIRVVCANTLAMAHRNDGSNKFLRVKHTKGMHDTLKVIQEVTNTANASFEATATQYKALARKSINRSDLRSYVKEVFDMPKEDKDVSTRSSNILDSIIARYDDSASLGRELLAAHEQRMEKERIESANLLDNILNSMDGGRGQTVNGGGTWWNALNSISEFASYDRGSKPESRLNQLWFGEGAKLNERALNTALNMSGVV